MEERRKGGDRRRDSEERMLTYGEAAGYAGVSRRTIIRWVKSGKLKARYLFGKNPRISFGSLKWSIQRMPAVPSSQHSIDLILSGGQEAGAKGGRNANQRPA